MALTQVPPALLTATTGTGTTVALSASPTFTGTVTTPSVTFSDASTQTAAASPYVLKNRIINGAMQIWQRGTSFSASGSNYYTADRWQNLGQTGTYSQSSDVPTGFKYSLSVACTSSAYGTLCERIESANSLDLAGQTVTLSFWAKATTGGASGLTIALDYPTAIDNFATTTNFATSSTSALTSTWTKYTSTFTSLNANVANGLQVYFYNTAGGSAAITYLITGVQLEIGTSATPFERRLYNQELANCQRYYQKFISVNGAYCTFGTGHIDSATAGYGTIVLPVTTRAAATFGSSGSIAFYSGNSFYPITSFGTVYYTLNTQGVNFTCSGGGMTAGRGGQIIANNSTTAYVDFNAEL